MAKAAACVVVLLAGFRAISDDDFSRVVIAQKWAHAPRLDPTATSWLPLPFWITGAVMLLFGSTLDSARATACILGILSAVLVAVAARRMAAGSRAALAAAVIAAVFPWSARLGVATVPELPAAALAFFAMASTVGLAGRAGAWDRLWGAAALVGATLSRYEAWPIAVGFSVLCVLDALRASHVGDGSRRPGDRASLLVAAAIALVGPAVWIGWNHHAHGDALHFIARVTAYKRALDGAPHATMLGRLAAYPVAMAKQEPELLGFLLASIAAAAFVPRLRPALFPNAARYARPAALALFQVAALGVAIAGDSAPTHHPERALLVVLLLVATAAGDLAASLFEAVSSTRDRAVLLAAWLCAILAGPLVIRRVWMVEDFLHRKDEVAIGRAAARAAKPGERVLVEAADYGYYAVTAAFGRPEDTVIDCEPDPRRSPCRSSFEDDDRLRRKLDEAGARLLIARMSAVTAALGPPVAAHGPWALWHVPADIAKPPERVP